MTALEHEDHLDSGPQQPRPSGVKRRLVVAGGFALGGIASVAGIGGAIRFVEGVLDRQREAARQRRIEAFLKLRPDLKEVSRSLDSIGGLWIMPNDGAVVNDELALSAKAYAGKGAPSIVGVAFTAYWPGAEPPDPEHNFHGWPVLDYIPARKGIFASRVSLKRLSRGLGFPPGMQMEISFDVVNSANQIKEAPHGVRRVFTR